MLAIIHSHRDEGGSPTELADKHAFDFRRTPDIHPEVLHQFSTYCKFGLGFPVVWLFAVCTATQPLLEESNRFWNLDPELLVGLRPPSILLE